MNIRYTFFSFLFILITTCASAQHKIDALFVGLKNSQNKIDALIKAGKAEEAEKLRQNQESENNQVINAFRVYFNYCPVYFFYLKDSKKVKDGNFKGVIYNTDFHIDSAFTGSNYLVGVYDKSDVNNLDAFFIKDRNFDQLHPAFYVRKNKFLIITKQDNEVVTLLNSRFWEAFPK
jgi:hypothetical protein